MAGSLEASRLLASGTSSARSGFAGAVGDHQARFGIADGEANAREEAGEELAVAVGEDAASHLGAGFGIDAQLREVERPLMGKAFLAAQSHVDLRLGGADGVHCRAAV